MAVVIVFIVIGLPILGAFGFATYKEWLKHRRKNPVSLEQLRSLYKDIEILKKENERLRQRVENLETIVASVEWDQLWESDESPSHQKSHAEESLEEVHLRARGKHRE
ncbi:MAG: hypothetical protein N2170_00340 [Bacteroidia bacterium]|nr:hypothetical protein [Bacteroidia bacterium]